MPIHSSGKRITARARAARNALERQADSGDPGDEHDWVSSSGLASPIPLCDLIRTYKRGRDPTRGQRRYLNVSFVRRSVGSMRDGFCMLAVVCLRSLVLFPILREQRK